MLEIMIVKHRVHRYSPLKVASQIVRDISLAAFIKGRFIHYHITSYHCKSLFASLIFRIYTFSLLRIKIPQESIHIQQRMVLL